MGSESENGDQKVRRRKHRSRKEGSSRSSRDGHRGHGSSSRSRRHRRDNEGSESAGAPIPVAGAVNSTADEDVEALDFDPNDKSIKTTVSRMSESHKSLKEDPDYVEETLQENIFSLIYISPVCSGAFWFAFFVAIFQLALPFLALLDLIVLNDDDGNYLQLPNNVSIIVKILAGMVLILAVVQFWDLMEALEYLQKGPPPSASDIPEGARCWKFYLSYFIQFLMGALFEIAVFVFIMQSTTILDIFLNFAALEFITSVDEFAFILAKRGYISNSVKKACDEVSETKVLRKKGGRICRRFQIVFFIAMMLIAYSILSNWQDRGKWDCEKIEVQFGDGYITILPIFSGIYTFEKGANQRADDIRLSRPVYWDKHRGAAFRYCRKDDSGIFSFANTGFWVFNIILDDVKTIDDMCENFISRSPDTKGFDLLEHPGRSWLTKRRLNDTVQYEVDFFQLRCGDCQEETCNGQCVNDECVCSDIQYGFNCQFNDPPCPKTDYDRRTKPFRGVGDKFSSKYSLMVTRNGKPFYSYNRPVYYFNWDDGVMDILLNFGRRYFLFDIVVANIKGAVQGFKPHPTDEDADPIPIINTSVVVDNLTHFHPWYDWIKPVYSSGLVNSTDERDNNVSMYKIPVFVSDPIDVGTQSDSLSPLGLGWKRINKQVISKRNYFDLFSRGSSAETVLVCSRCSESAPCLNGGTCQRNNTCRCQTPEEVFEDDDEARFENPIVHSGTLCELDCTEEGNDLNPACQSDFNPWADDDFFDEFDDEFDDDEFDDGFFGDEETPDEDVTDDNPDEADGDDQNPDAEDEPDGADGDDQNLDAEDEPDGADGDDQNLDAEDEPDGNVDQGDGGDGEGFDDDGGGDGGDGADGEDPNLDGGEGFDDDGGGDGGDGADGEDPNLDGGEGFDDDGGGDGADGEDPNLDGGEGFDDDGGGDQGDGGDGEGFDDDGGGGGDGGDGEGFDDDGGGGGDGGDGEAFDDDGEE